MAPEGARHPWLWPISTALRLGAASFDVLERFIAPEALAPRPQPPWTTPHETVLDLPLLTVLRFSGGAGKPVIVVAPFALHGPVIADLAPGHSLIERLLAEEVGPLLLVAWRSATPGLRLSGIDDYLAQLAVVLDDLGRPASLIGLCQGGWLSLMAAARFPRKVRRLVIAGAPVDLDAGPSRIVASAREAPPELFETIVQGGGGLVIGDNALSFWGERELQPAAVADVLQVAEAAPDLVERFRVWHGWTLDLPGVYYLQVVEELFRRNAFARGSFRALGRTLKLSALRTPLFAIAAEADDVAPPAQVLAAARLIGTRRDRVSTAVVGGGHLSLFMGRQNLATVWPQAVSWLKHG